ncbi:hypothetical protein [Psychrobacter sp.]|uniref:hypothetical protein n=1 Tax=Psychrobacter sp. TaxID=56811 RepID=UPI003C78796A
MDYLSLLPEINAVKVAILSVIVILINIFSVLLAYSWFNRFQRPDTKEYRKWRDDFGGGSIGDYNSWKRQNNSYSKRSSGRRYNNRRYYNNRRRGRW